MEGLRQRAPEHEPERDDHRADEQRHAPAPAVERGFIQRAREPDADEARDEDREDNEDQHSV